MENVTVSLTTHLWSNFLLILDPPLDHAMLPVPRLMLRYQHDLVSTYVNIVQILECWLMVLKVIRWSLMVLPTHFSSLQDSVMTDTSRICMHTMSIPTRLWNCSVILRQAGVHMHVLRRERL